MNWIDDNGFTASHMVPCGDDRIDINNTGRLKRFICRETWIVYKFEGLESAVLGLTIVKKAGYMYDCFPFVTERGAWSLI